MPDPTDNAVPEELEPHRDLGRGKAAKTRAADAIHDLAVAMAEMRESALAELPLGDNAREALDRARKLGSKKRERPARRRQLLYLAGLLRHEEPEDLQALREAIESDGGNSPRELALQMAERWRARILERGDEAIEELLLEHPEGDRQRLRQIARAARKATVLGKKKRAARELFVAIRDVLGID